VTDDIGYVDDALYEDVVAFFRSNIDWSGPADRLGRPDAAAAILRESRVLDARDYETWLSLFTDQCIYWVPLNAEVGDPRVEPAVHFDDHRRLADRVDLLRTGHLHAQIPPSQTCRVVSNIECRSSDNGEVDVHSILIVHEQRRGRTQLYVGRQFHRLEQSDDLWRIKYRVLLLVDRDVSQGNTTFIL
jgi:3-phenylpropionate/cinnamic acid dioxygenase small subunit